MLPWFAAAALAECPEGRVDRKRVQAPLAAAEQAFARMDEVGFAAAHADAAALLACLAEPADEILAVAWHRHEALVAFLAGDEAATVRSLQAATRVYGGDALPRELAPPGTALRALYEDAWRDVPTGTEPLPSERTAWVDGRRGQDRPGQLPALIQLADDRGRVAWTGYVQAGAALPAASTLVAPGPAERARGLHWGVEVGLPIGGRVEWTLANEYVEAVALRVGANGSVGGVRGLQVAVAGEVPFRGRWQFEPSAGFLVGNGSGGLVALAAQYDPPGAFQLNLGLGLMLAGVPLADINAGWVW
jgi:hypothetical protein